MRTLLKFALLFIIFSLLFILPNVLIPLHIKMGHQSEYNSFMLLLLLLAQLSSIIYLIKRLNLWGVKLFLCLIVVFWGLQTFMPQVETWYFREAMPAITDEELRNLFLRPLITAITFIPVAMWVLGKWKPGHAEFNTQANLTWKKILSLSIAYVIIYFVFGYFVAWQFEEVRIFYTGSPADAGFIGQIEQMLQTKSSIFLFQFLRGFLWIIAGLPIIFYLRGSGTEKIIACVILYSLPAIQLIVDNPFMPRQVRMAHLLEVTTSNGLFGLFIGCASIYYRKNLEHKEK